MTVESNPLTNDWPDFGKVANILQKHIDAIDLECRENELDISTELLHVELFAIISERNNP